MRNPTGHSTVGWLTAAGLSLVLAAAAPTAAQTIRSTLTGTVTDPGNAVVTISVFKRTTLGSGRSLELRVETFNVFNRPQFSNPNTSFGNSQFGRISSTRLPSREIQLGARVLF
jgi:hypothetical protein